MSMDNGIYNSRDTQSAWCGWQAAWQARAIDRPVKFMSFDDWRKSLPAGHGHSAEEAFNAGKALSRPVVQGDEIAKIRFAINDPFLAAINQLHQTGDSSLTGIAKAALEAMQTTEPVKD